MATATPLSWGFRQPDEIRRGADYLARVSPTRDGVVVVTAATLRVLNEGGTVVASPAVTVAAGVCTATILAAITATVDPVMGWQLEWTVTETAGAVEVGLNPADVVLYRVGAVIGWDDLVGRHADLATRLSVGSKAGPKILDAWSVVCQRLRQRGKRPCLIVDSFALRESHLLLALAYVFRDLAAGGEGSPEWSWAEHYDAKFEAEWATLTFEVADESTWRRTLDRSATRGAVWLGSVGTSGYREFTRPLS